MKLLSSPNSNSSSTSSSSSSGSFPPNVCTSQSATATCLTSILRRILCSRSLPSDHITLTDTDTDTNTSSHPIAAAAAPGIVARLMGLDSIFSPTQQNDHKHQLLPSKPSFLEMPAFFELENEDFFLLTFDTRERNSKRKKRTRRRRRKSNENAVRLGHKEDKEAGEGNEEHLTRRISDDDSTRTKKKISPCSLRIVEQEDCNSQDLSPVSVLDFDQFLFYPPEDCTIRRKLSSRLEDYSPLSTPTEDNSSGDDQNSKVIEETCQQLRDNYSHTQQHCNRQGEICRLAEAQVVQWNWKFNDVEDISADFGLGILDHLLEELVDQLYSRS